MHSFDHPYIIHFRIFPCYYTLMTLSIWYPTVEIWSIFIDIVCRRDWNEFLRWHVIYTKSICRFQRQLIIYHGKLNCWIAFTCMGALIPTKRVVDTTPMCTPMCVIHLATGRQIFWESQWNVSSVLLIINGSWYITQQSPVFKGMTLSV